MNKCKLSVDGNCCHKQISNDIKCDGEYKNDILFCPFWRKI